MSQVQIRQIPPKSFTSNQQIIGSWFPTGYYGHFRARSRIELCNDFRQLAQPNPPSKFLARQNSEASTHMFSQHDNRSKFECDPLVRSTQEGFGRRKVKTKAQGKFDPFFISWAPKIPDSKESTQDFQTSYNHDYNSTIKSPQTIYSIEPIHSSSASCQPTAYSSVHSHGQPDQEQSRKIRQETYQRYASAFTRRSQIKRTDRSPSVASCLIWNDSKNENKLSPPNEPITSPIVVNKNINDNDLPTINKSKRFESQSMQILKIGPVTSQDNQNTRLKSSCQRSTSLKETRINSMDHLITKYM